MAQELAIGSKGQFTKTVTESDVNLFAGITGDFYDVHVNEEFARKTQFGGRIAHGAYSVGLVSAAVSRLLALAGVTGYPVGYDVKFTGPIKLGDTVTTEVTTEEALGEGRYRLTVNCVNQSGVRILKGETVAQVL
ncbi:MAG: enoyl-CoA hydratase [Clostridia bacterium]|nr:enoyl-CoA hydratase [Clostridia bacterium]